MPIAPGVWTPLTVVMLTGILFVFTSGSTASAADWGVSVIFGQFDTAVPGSSADSGKSLQMPFKVAGVLIVSLGMAVLCYFALFRLFLDKPGDPVWPVTLYGRLTAFWWLFTWLMAAGILWYDLPIETKDVGFLSEHGLRGLFILIAILGALMIRYLLQSNKPDERREPNLTK